MSKPVLDTGRLAELQPTSRKRNEVIVTDNPWMNKKEH